MGSDQIIILCGLFSVLDKVIDKVANSCSAIYNSSFLLMLGLIWLPALLLLQTSPG